MFGIPGLPFLDPDSLWCHGRNLTSGHAVDVDTKGKLRNPPKVKFNPPSCIYGTALVASLAWIGKLARRRLTMAQYIIVLCSRGFFFFPGESTTLVVRGRKTSELFEDYWTIFPHEAKTTPTGTPCAEVQKRYVCNVFSTRWALFSRAMLSNGANKLIASWPPPPSWVSVGYKY